MDTKPNVAAALRHIPVFPLPASVLFPGVVLPLHIVEAPYREMVRDSMACHRCIVVAMVLPDKGDRKGDTVPPLCEVGCMARIIHASEVEDGRFNILVQGIDRVRLVQEVRSPGTYRVFATEPIARPSASVVRAAHADLVRLQSCVYSLGKAAAECDQELVEVLRSTADPVELSDILAAVLVSEPVQQQRLLATSDLKHRLRQLMETLAEVLLRYGDAERPRGQSGAN